MAATATKIQNTLVVKYKDGVNASGKEVVKSQRFAKIKPTATEQDLYDLGKQVEILLGKTLDEITVEAESSITNA